MTKYLSTVNVFFLLLTAFYTQFAASGELVKKDYLNTYEMPVVIKVPYYEKGAREPVEIELTLQPGDLYKSRSGKNGLVYEKYGIIEKTFAEFIKKERPAPAVKALDIRDKINKRYEKYLEGLKSEKMPKDWVELYREEIPRKLDYFERTIKNYLEWQAKGSYVERELKKARSDLAFYQSIRHRTDDLEDPASDPDQDGLDNRTEYARGTHPLLKDYVSAYPKYYEVVYDHSPVVTGTFYLVNTFNKSVTVDWDNLLSRFSDFYKLNISINGQPAPEIINLPPASTNRLDCFFNAEAFPRFFDEAYKIDFFDITNEFDNAHFSVRFHTYEDNSRPLISPKIVKPENGSLYSCNDEIAFSWEEPEGKAMKKDRNERMHYKLQFIDPFGVKGERDVSKSGNAFVKRHQNFKANELEPGTYFWRANKQDRFHAPVSSDWGWLAIGREIAPEKPKGKGSD
ncbi:hypothetical protein IKS73_02515 [bacterium]|nr:hypothetical protein [bacterium]